MFTLIRRQSTLALALAIAATSAFAAPPAARHNLFYTLAPGNPNYLVVVDTTTHLKSFVSTGAAGTGCSATAAAGAVAAWQNLVAAVNTCGQSVTLFVRNGDTVDPIAGRITLSSPPVSVAIRDGELAVLTQQSVNFYSIGTTGVISSDGSVSVADSTGGQIVWFNGGVGYTLKSGSEWIINFGQAPGSGFAATQVTLAPGAPNNDTPLGLVGRNNNLYVTVAHSDLQLLVVNGSVSAAAFGPSPYRDSQGNLTHAPCWNALWEQFLYSSDSPGKQLLRYLVSDTNIFYEKPVYSFQGPPTDLANSGSVLGVIDGGAAGVSNITLLNLDAEGEPTLGFALKVPGALAGAAFSN
jgi:hypothetical protein